MSRFNFLFLIIFFSLLGNNISAQNYLPSAISSELLTDANAVIREYNSEFIQTDTHNGSHKVTYIITILNKNGDDFSDFTTYEDTFRELKSFSGELYNSAGKVVKKISKKDLITTGLSSNLATDGKYTYCKLYSPSYPYTIKYVYETKYKNGILSYPPFFPLPYYGVALEKATHILQLPLNVELREKQKNIDIKSIKESDAKKQSVQYSLSNIKAIPYEQYASDEDLFPIIYLSPDNFCADKHCGELASWEKFGTWIADLLKDRDKLPQSTIDKVNSLTANVSDTRQKVKILYEYLQSTTHYVSIQLGIGGWQPMLASEVARTGFGDCKGLTNYMKAMLNAAGIPSYYVVIRLDREEKRLLGDFPNFSQCNHVILAVPLDNDTVWLECTSQILPFGYIHSGIAGHDAMMVGENFAKFATLPSNPPAKNREINKVEINISPEGDAEMKVKMRFEEEDFENIYMRMHGMSKKDETDFLGKMLHVNKPSISNIQKQEFLSENPAIDISFDLQSEEYAQQTGTRLFIPVNPIHTSMRRLSGKTRKHDLFFSSNLNETDTIIIKIPETYQIESPPKVQTISSAYGSFKTEVSVSEGVITYIQHTELFDGNFSVAEFNDIKTFYENIEKAQAGKIALKKREN